MISGSKRLISILLSLIMLASLFGGTGALAVEDAAADEEVIQHRRHVCAELPEQEVYDAPESDGYVPEEAVLSSGETMTFDRYGYTTLTDTQKTIYEAIVPAIRDMSQTKTSFSTATDADLARAVDMAVSDYPEYFWFTGAYWQYGSANSRNGFKPILKLEGVTTEDVEAVKAAKVTFDAAVEEFLDAGPATVGYSALLDIHDRLALHVTYDSSTVSDQSAYGALINGTAVCAGYAKAYQVLVNAHSDSGISAYYITGTGNGGAHGWNLVALTSGGTTYYMYTDVTWDDQDTKIYHAYFNMPLSVFNYDHVADGNYSTPAGTDKYSYFNMQELSKYTNAGAGIVTASSGTFNKTDFAERVTSGQLTYSIDIWCDPNTNGGIAFTDWYNGNKSSQASVLQLSSYSISYSYMSYEYKLTYTSKAAVTTIDQSRPEPPTLKSATDTTIILNNIISPYGTTTVYTRDNGATWSESPVFTNLSEATQYTFYAKFLGNDSYNESEWSYPTTVSTVTALAQEPPDTPTVLNVTKDSITVSAIDSNLHGNYAQYSINGGATWQTSNTFSGLTQGTVYTVYARYAQGNGYAASLMTDGVKVLCGTLSDAASIAVNGSFSGNDVSSVCVAEKAAASVTSAYNLGTLTYTWTYGSGGTVVSSGTEADEIIVPSMAYNTSLKLSVTSSVYTSEPAEKTVTVGKAPISSALTVKLSGSVSGDEPQICTPGETLSVSVTPISPFSAGTLTYSWYLNDELISSQTSSTFTIPKDYAGQKIGVSVSSSSYLSSIYRSAAVSKLSQEAPAAPEISYILKNSVCIKPVDSSDGNTVQYSSDGGDTWQDSNVFTNLTRGGTYTFIARIAESGSYNESPVSEGTTVTVGYFSDFAEAAVSGSISGSNISACVPGETLTAEVTAEENVGTVTYKWYCGGSLIGEGAEIAIPNSTLYAGKTVTVKAASSLYTDSDGAISKDIAVSKLVQSAPSAPVITRITEGSATVQPVDSPNGTAVEYSCDGGISWQDSNAFTNLTRGETYSFAVRFAGNTSYESSPASKSTKAMVGYFYDAAAVTVKGSISGSNISACVPGETLTAEVTTEENVGTVTYRWYCGGSLIGEGAEFAIPNSTLYAGKTVTVKAASSLYTAEGGELTRDITVGKVTAEKPAAPVIEAKSFNSVRLKEVTSPGGTTVQYSCGGETWQTGTLFTGLEPKTEYTFYVRYLGDSVNEASEISGGTAVITECDKGSLCPANAFKDVSKSSWFHMAVDYVKENGVMSGKSSTTFVPNANLTRAEIVQVLYNMEGKPAVSIPNTYTDIKPSDWYYNAILWAKENNIASGTSETRFSPGAQATREQVVLMLMKYIELKGGSTDAAADISGYSDANKVSSWALVAVQWAIAEGVISGTGGNNISPRGITTRAQIAQMIYNYFG